MAGAMRMQLKCGSAETASKSPATRAAAGSPASESRLPDREADRLHSQRSHASPMCSPTRTVMARTASGVWRIATNGSRAAARSSAIDETPKCECHESRVGEPEGGHEHEGLPFGDVGPRSEGRFPEETPQRQTERIQQGCQSARDRQENDLAHRRA